MNSPRTLEKLDLAALNGFAGDNLREAFAAFWLSADALVSGQPATRPTLPSQKGLQAIAAKARVLPRDIDEAVARQFFEQNFTPYLVGEDGFLTGYYEPEVEGSLTRSADFAAPILSRPASLVSFAPGQALPSSLPAHLVAGLALQDGAIIPCPDREAIEAGALQGQVRPLVWLRDAVEVFLIQVQGSARVRLPDGSLLRLAYAGRNGHPYTSIGRILVESGEISATDMSLAKLKGWIRAHGLQNGEAGRTLMQRNLSYVFFDTNPALDPGLGPVGGAGVSLTPLRSIAVDRTLWFYGLPFWIQADLPWQTGAPTPFHRLMIAQDTGSAILGPARADIFFGTGDAAGERAGDLHHRGRFVVFLPKGEEP